MKTSEKLAAAIELLRQVASDENLDFSEYPETLMSFDELVSEMSKISIEQ